MSKRNRRKREFDVDSFMRDKNRHERREQRERSAERRQSLPRRRISSGSHAFLSAAKALLLFAAVSLVGLYGMILTFFKKLPGKTNLRGNRTGFRLPVIAAGSVILVTVLFAVIFSFTNKNALEISLNGEPVGIIKEKGIAPEEIYFVTVKKLEAAVGYPVKVAESVTVAKVHASKSDIISLEQLYAQIYVLYTYRVEAVRITVDGEVKGTVATMSDAEAMFGSLKDVYVQEGLNITEIAFVEDVRAEEVLVANKFEIMETDEVYKELSGYKDGEKIYEIRKGDTLSKICADFGINMDDIKRLNPGLDERSILRIGQQIVLGVAKPLLSVRTVAAEKYSQPIPFESEIEYNPDMYKGAAPKIRKQGVNGQEDVVAEVTRINGEETEREIVERTTTLEPVSEIKEVGTGQTPPKQSVGTFILPTRGRLTERFAARDGKHKGIDLANTKGTAVYASDGGTVVSASYSGNFGNLIIIDHGNGFETYYAHNSQMLVKAGQNVAQGELIAKMGSSGDSSGSHLHFEIHRNGVAANPYNFIN